LTSRLSEIKADGVKTAGARAAGEIGLDWRQTVTHRELSAGKVGPDDGAPGGQVTEDRPGETTGERPAGGPDRARNEVQADGDGHKTMPIQAQEA
jgi:hypothetical protein